MSESAAQTSPYLSLRRAVQPAIIAHCLLAADQERAGKLAAECEDLLFLTRELLKAAGRAQILATERGPGPGPGPGAGPGPGRGPGPGPGMPDAGEVSGDRPAQLLDAYADAGLLWAKVVGSSLALAGALIASWPRSPRPYTRS